MEDKNSQPRMGMAIFWGGLACGVLDIAYAFALYGARGVPPVRLLQGIARGLIGPAALRGGAATALFGLLLHFTIAFGAAVTFCLASRKLGWIIRRAFASGLLFGVAVYLFMNFVVIPLSAIHRWPVIGTWFVVNLIEHMFIVGLPIALAARTFMGTANEELATGTARGASQSV
jgi:uncharacterized membrane protein YagU involved in acid resistance